MDPQRFDTLTKSLTMRRSRRAAVRGLAGGLLAGALGLRGWQVNAAADCTHRCSRLPAGSAQDQCLAARGQISQAQATAEAEANQTRTEVEATANAARAQTETDASQARATAEAETQQARATAEAEANQVRATAEASGDGDVGGGDFFCDDRTFWCLSFDRKTRIGDIGKRKMCYHASTASCRACDPDGNDALCNATYGQCGGLCSAQHGCGTYEMIPCLQCAGSTPSIYSVGPYLTCIDPNGHGCSPCKGGWKTSTEACDAQHPAYCNCYCSTDPQGGDGACPFGC